MRLTPVEAMRLAIAEGHKGVGFVSPNPLVGCVILDKNGQLLSKGFHARLGGPHAEASAVQNVLEPERLKGAHVYVTLEPCAHQGRTPSCAKLLASLPIAKVIYGIEDPNPLVNGKGLDILQQAGIQVEKFVGLDDELKALPEIFMHNQIHKRPYVAVKVASSWDGMASLIDGQSRWITGDLSRARVHELRGAYDLVLTGAGTVLQDDPRLDSRAPGFETKSKRLAVLDPKGRCSASLGDLNISKIRPPEDLFFFTGPGVARSDRATFVEVAERDGNLDLREILDQLFQRDVRSVFVEAGPVTVGRWLASGLVNRIYLFVGAKILGQGRPWSGELNFPTLDKAIRLTSVRAETLGDDILIQGLVVTSDSL
ncbi:MAG: bifunctional diaminohydroxyphosphoribosylaminopyrimidine deaminase/5-amino-6-(5-phosphoribosylamino)uracil reductase RibD [Bdellovibrionales bacterium]